MCSPDPRRASEHRDFLALDMLDRGIPLLLLPDLAWPGEVAARPANRFHIGLTRLLTSHRSRAASSIGRAADS